MEKKHIRNSFFGKKKNTQKSVGKHVAKHDDTKQQHSNATAYNKQSSQSLTKKAKKGDKKIDSKSTHGNQSHNKETTIVLAGVQTGLRMTKIKATHISSETMYQKDNPVSVPQSRSYPKGAVPHVVSPDTSLQLVSSDSGKPISEVLTAFNKGASDEYVSFDEAIAYVQACEDIQEGQEIQYIGGGKFAVVEFEQQNKKKHMKIVRTIDFETVKDMRVWREQLQYKVPFIEIEEISPLSELYTQKEIDSFREFNNN